eukprot:scaffold20365_cov78-Skeletonema_dohrnii-CCMP3373.AAC.3
MSDLGWEQLGHDISNNTHLTSLDLHEGALDNHTMSSLFRGLTRSNSIREMRLYENELSVAGVRSMRPFLTNAENLILLDLDDNNNLQSEGFNTLFRALRNSPIVELMCVRCCIESIEIDREHIPKHLKHLHLNKNIINADGCRGLSKLLQGGASTLTELYLNKNEIDDDGVEILVNSLQSNTSLTTLDLRWNDGISKHGNGMLLKLVNNVSSIKATLQSNHTLKYIRVAHLNQLERDEIQTNIEKATRINKSFTRPAREKVIQTQLRSQNRAELCRLQGIDRSLYSEIDPLHLPEVLSLIGQKHGRGELYVALSLSIMTLFSTINRQRCIQQEKEYHAAKAAEHAVIAAEHRAKVEELENELVAMEKAAEGNEGNDDTEYRDKKRRRKWWWGLWGVA